MRPAGDAHASARHYPGDGSLAPSIPRTVERGQHRRSGWRPPAGGGNRRMRVALISTYELGRQPFSVASAAARLAEAGHAVSCLDLAVEPSDETALAGAELIAFSLPMHT